MAKEISFSEFLKEGALKEEQHSKVQELSDKPKPFRLEAEEVASDSDVRAFWKRLRHFFRTGEKPGEKNGVFVPALIAPYLQNGNWDTEYPFYLSPERAGSCSVSILLEGLCEEIFETKDAKILKDNLPRLVSYFEELIPKESGAIEFEEAAKKAFDKLTALEVHGDEGKRFKDQLIKLFNALPKEGYVLDFHHEVPLHFVRQNLGRIDKIRKEYKALIKRRIEKVEDLLSLDKEKTKAVDKPQKGFEFADDLIALDKVQSITPVEGSQKLSEARLNRIQGILDILKNTVESSENNAHLIINQDLKDSFNWESIFPSCKLGFETLEGAFQKAESIFDNNIGNFTKVIVAMRKAELELNNEYEAEVHDDYFEHFKWFKLSADELELFPPVILVTGANDLLQNAMASFSNVLASNKPIKLLALTNRTTHEVNPDIDWEEASHGFRQELAAIAMSHRAAHTLQCASDHAFSLLSGISSSFETIAPSVMHVLVPEAEENHEISFLKINAAAAGRYFPYLAYDTNRGSQWGSRFDISDNSQAEKDWPDYPFHYTSIDGTEVDILLKFTYADYKAMTAEKVEELLLVPDAMVTDYLIPVTDYLNLNQDEVTGKVPYIWLVDEDNRMVRAAIPYMWVVSCQERLDFWNFVQEISGVNSYHVQNALDSARKDWEKEKEEELKSLQKVHENALQEVKKSAASESMENLVNVLLNMDTANIDSTKKAAPKKAEIKPKAEKPKMEKKAKPEKKKVEEEPSAEAWLETFKCTSCNDCTDRFPAIFDYNEDKQAFIKDASKGTYEHLVLAAEGCPAACIHPGDPLNSKEPNLDELKKRAAKFN